MKSEAMLRSHEFSRIMRAAQSQEQGIPTLLQQQMQENTNKNFGRKVKPQPFPTSSGDIWSYTLLEMLK